MAETSGFFQAMWDESLKNPITEENTGWWDRDYVAKQFMDYFALFIGNGVFISPTNQLKVSVSTGMVVNVNTGWAFINGGWYHNDEIKSFTINDNTSSQSRTDSIRLRYSESNRSITCVYISGDTQLSRGDNQYDLELAQIVVTPSMTTITASSITDSRSNENRCGFVKGLMDVITTDDLFSQLQGQFDDWFNSVKNQLQGDLAIKLQLEFTELNKNVEDYQNSIESDIKNFKSEINSTVNSFQTTASEQIEEATGLVDNYVNNDYTTEVKTLEFVNKVCEVADSKVTANSLIDVYFTADTIQEAEDCKIYVDSETGKIKLTAEEQPTKTIKAIFRVRVIE